MGNLTVTVNISDGTKMLSERVEVPDDLLDSHLPGNDGRQNRAQFEVAAAFTNAYRMFTKGGDDNANDEAEEGRSEESEDERGSEEDRSGS